MSDVVIAEPTAVTIGDTVRITFLGYPPQAHKLPDEPLKLFWNNRAYVISLGMDGYVPFECAKSYFGDPRSSTSVQRVEDENGIDMIIPDRPAEVRRLQQYWQNSIIKFREYIPGDRSFLADGISDLLPLVETWTLSGQRIMMVTDDPYGDHVVAATNTIAERERQHAQLLEQSAQIVELRKMNQLMMQKLGVTPDDLAKMTPNPPPIQTQPPVMEAPISATLAEAPEMVYNPRTRKVVPKPTFPTSDPTRIADLPVDQD